MSTDDTRSSAAIIDYRGPGGRFTSAGTPGRPVGSKNRISNEAMQSVRGMKDEAIAQLKVRLLAGDWQALQFVLEKCLPRGRVVELDAATPQAITTAMTEGSITPEEAKHAATALAKLAELSDLEEIKARLVELERAANER